MKRFLSLALSLLVLISLLAGCGGESAASNDMAYSEVESGSLKSETSDSLTSDTALDSAVSEDRKLIKTVYLDAETEQYDPLIDGLNQKITELGGYIQTRETDNYRSRYCSMVIRIPAENLDRFVEHVSTNANVTSSSESAQDVTLEYVDTEAKITALETEQTRLLELLAEANNLTAILQIEERLSEVTYELERYSSQLRTLENQVSYSTVHLSIREVEVLTPTEDPTVWERISTGFAETLQELGEKITDIFVWIIVESPNILLCGLFIGMIYLFTSRIVSKRRKKHFPPEEQPK